MHRLALSRRQLLQAGAAASVLTAPWAAAQKAGARPLPAVGAPYPLAAVPLLGSLITEPAAMTIAALMLAPQIFRADVPEGRKYLALGVLFVNVASGRRTWAEHWKLQNALVLFNPAPVT